MTWILEEPVYILSLGAVTLAFLGFAWSQTGYRSLFHAMLAVVALTVGLLILERQIVTPVEEIKMALNEIAEDVQTNDLERILSHVHSQATAVHARARAEFPRYEFKRVDIKRNVEVTFPQGSELRTRAEVTFNVRVDVEVESTGIMHRVPRFVRVTLMYEDGRWRVAEYSHDDPQTSIRNR